jgi:glycosyltransferase involved in cell wall biosynthesis
MLNSPEVGRLVSPKSPQGIAEAVVELLNDPALRVKIAAAARQRVLEEYNITRSGDLLEACYCQAIKRRKALGSRKPGEAKAQKVLALQK